MKYTTSIDGTKVKFEDMDLDGDGIVGEEETLTRKFDRGITEIKETTELKDAIAEFNKDEINTEGLTSMDFMGRILNEYELMPLKIWDSLRAMRCISIKAHRIGRISLRKNIALDAFGRKGFIDLVTGKRQDDNLSKVQKMGNFTGFNQR